MAANRILVFFARHKVAGNLLMALMILFGLLGLGQLNRQLMPDFTIEQIQIDITWVGASTQDMESNVIEPLEREFMRVDNLDRVNATSFEGRAVLLLEFDFGSNMAKALTDTQSAVARVATFPQEMERPVVRLLDPTEVICNIEISGPFTESALKAYAWEIRTALLQRGVSSIRMSGLRKSELRVEVPAETLRRLDLTLDDIAQRIARSSLDLPGGTLETDNISRQIRSERRARTAAELGELEVLSNESGERLQLKDIARIHETAADGEVARQVGEYSSINMNVRRSRGVDSMLAQQWVVSYLEEFRATAPSSLRVETFDVLADQVTQRVNMLLVNGAGGLMLVLAVLYVFLGGRPAFWVAVGIPISFLAAMAGMAAIGLSLNMISMFALIMGIGIIVDDAIVVSEHAGTLYDSGVPGGEAAERAARIMLPPVLAASLTTLAAFLPILMVQEEVGSVIKDLPLTLSLVIAASLVECFLILPMHLRSALKKQGEPAPWRVRFDEGFARFRQGAFTGMLRAALRNRYASVTTALCLFLLSITMMSTGRVGFDFFPAPESDLVFANFAFTPGAPRRDSEFMVAELGRSSRAAERNLGYAPGELIAFGVGSVATRDPGVGNAPLEVSADHLGVYTLELAPGDTRAVRNEEFIEAWKREATRSPGVEKLIFFSRQVAGPPGNDVELSLSGAGLEDMKAAAVYAARWLQAVPGVDSVDDDLPRGKQEILLEITPAGEAMGFSASEVARQVRNAYEGALADRVPRDEEELRVLVKLPEAGPGEAGLRNLYLRSRSGVEAPLTEIVDLRQRVGFSQIQRTDGVRQVTVSADINPTMTTSGQVIRAMQEQGIMRTIRERYGVSINFLGRAEQQQMALADFRMAAIVALGSMYIVLAWVFARYATPLVVMSVIPFGLVGAILGHLAFGFNLSMFSLVALLGLAGVLVNDSIILVSAIRRHSDEGEPLMEALVHGAQERLRPVLMTSMTTIVGVTPILFEGSLQAQLVQPLAITLVFGLMLAPPLVLVYVPCVMAIGADLRRRVRSRRAPSTAPDPTPVSFRS